MIFIYILAVPIGMLIALAGFIIGMDSETKMQKAKWFCVMFVGILLVFLPFAACVNSCVNNNEYSVSKDFNEVTGEPRNPCPFGY